MQQKPLVIRQWSWKLATPQFLVLGILIVGSIFIFWQHYQYLSIALGAITYLIYSYSSRALLLRHHRNGRRLCDQGNYLEAIHAFEKSHKFFSENAWIDEYRSLTMMTPALQTFREMALINIAYCYAHLGNIAQAETYYRRALSEYPSSIVAQNGLAAIKSTFDND